MSPRRAAVLLSGLPGKSATWRVATDGESEWDLQNQLLATIADCLAQISWQLSGDKSAAKPKPIARPGIVSDERRYGKTKRSPKQVASYLMRFRPKKAIEES